MQSTPFNFLDGSGFNAQGQNVPAPANSQTSRSLTAPKPNVLAQGVNLNVPKTIPTQSLTANVTNFDLSKVLAQNQQTRDAFLNQLNNTKGLNAARQRSTDAYNTLQNFDVSLEGGIQNILKKPVALEFQQGQASALTRDAAFTRSSLARSYEATGLDLQNVQQARADLLKQYEYLMQFGQEDVNNGFKLDEIRRADEKLKYDQMQAAKEFALKQQVSKPYYEVGGTIYRASDGKAYSTPEEFWADGGSKNFSDVQGNLQTPEDRSLAQQQQQFNSQTAFQREQLSQDKWYKEQTLAQSKYTVTQDALGNPIAFNTKTGEAMAVNVNAINSVAPDGGDGGQCGTFAHTIADFPPVGDLLTEKQATVNKNGIRADQWRKEGAQPGDVLIFNIGQYGHVSVVTQNNGDGTVTVKDSNYSNPPDGKIRTRTVNINDQNIYGALRGQLKNQFIGPVQGQAPLYSDVPIKLRPHVQTLAGNFDNEAIVKKYNTVAEGYGFVQGIDNNTKNPADNQALISAFAKALNPESVVREGEYATVQKYAQSWAESFKFNAIRVVNNQEFLTPQAIDNMKRTIASKYEVVNSQYQNLYNDYGRRIDAITGKGNGTQYLPNYSQGVTNSTSQSASPEQQYLQSIMGSYTSQPTQPTQPAPASNKQNYSLGQVGKQISAWDYIKNLFR